MSDPKGTVLITGAAGGLGNALVECFAAEGWRVLAGCRVEGNSFPDGVCEISLDVSDDDQVQETVSGLWKEAEGIDCVINNAAVIRDQLSMKMPESDWDTVIDVCLKGAWRVNRVAMRLMMRQRSGLIVNVGSFSGMVGYPGQSNYAAAKAGLIGLTQSMAKEGGPRGVRANVVLPGLMETRMIGKLTDERRAELLELNTLKRMSDPAQVARFVEFLTGMDQVSGQVFNLDSRILPWS